MTIATNLESAVKAPFGTVFADKMSISWFKDDQWSPVTIQDMGPLPIMPYTHVLHYGSSCFEGLKAHRTFKGDVNIFRLDRHVRRMQSSADLLCLPEPGVEQLTNMILDLVRESLDWVPDHPGSLYIRPTLIGTLPSIGAAGSPSTQACLFTILSPVGDYFAGGLKPLKIAIEDQQQRSTPGFGMAKAGGNYAAALKNTMRARKSHGVNQMLFAPGGDVQETGAANFFLINNDRIITKGLASSFLHGITRDSVLTIARDMGYTIEERDITVDEVLEFAKTGEAALSGTAAVLSGIGTFVYRDELYQVNGGEIGPNTLKLRQALLDIQNGSAEDKHGWLQRV